MPDLMHSARLFETSSRLQDAATCLAGIADDVEVDEVSSVALKWAGLFLSRVDWKSEAPPDVCLGHGFTAEATSVRPAFYAAILRAAPQLSQVGLQSENDVFGFLRALYAILRSGGRDRSQLTSEKLRAGARLLSELSQGILVQLGNTGTPRRSPWLKVEPVA